MRLRTPFLIVAVAFLSLTADLIFAQTAKHLVISEVLIDGVNESAASNNDEFVEIYNPTDDWLDMGGWTIDYRSASSTTFTTKYTFPSGTIIWPHKYYLFGGGGVANRDNSSQSLLLGLSNSGGAVFLRNTTKMTVDLVGWGSAVAGNYEGTVCPKAAQGISLERKAKSASDATSMGIGGTDEFAGNGYDTDNNANDFVQRTTPQPQSSASPAEPSTYANGDGTGVATISPMTLNTSETSSIIVTLVGDTVHVLDSVIVVVPSGWGWSRDAGSVHLNQSQSLALLTVISDTIFAGSVHVTNVDTLELTITNVTAPAVGGNGIFQMKTAVGGGTPMPIANPPSVEVLKLVPIGDIHINDSQGVPASPYQTGTAVTVSGIITADLNATRTDLYLQDVTAGINIFSYSRSYNYQVGDSITFTGTIQQYRGTTEIMPDSAKTVFHSHGNPIPEPMLLTASDVNLAFNADNYTEPNEGRLVRINGVTYNATNQTISDFTGTTGGFIPNTLSIPTGTFDLIGILKQYKPGTPAPPAPYTADYEIVARTQDDIITHSGPVFVEKPSEENIQPNSVAIYFKTGSFSKAVVKYGASSTYTDSVVAISSDTVHTITLGGLLPAKVYHYQAAASDTSGTNRTGDAIFSTASQTGTTGIINVYFSKSVDTTVARGEKAQTVDISSKFISKINAAQYSIDVALYSLSGTVGSNVATALINAKNRGVKVRMIIEDDNSNTAPMSMMKSSGIQFITDMFDPLNAGSGLMHNKFAVFDLRDTSSFADDWVWTGSWNATDPGNNSDAQNAVEIQDKALANAYTMEFNEMWGSSTDMANSSQSRFGIRKTDNTPHKFNINGTPVELYFSPSDQTTFHIYEMLSRATCSINISMLTFTRSDLAQAMVAKKAAGEKVRVVLDNNTDNGNQFNFLQNGGVDIRLKGSSLSGLLHHKYALIDAENPNADDIVITGSHNWSNSAETSNNENTLMIHSKRVANLYLQEFKARYIEAGGSDNIAVGVKQAGNDLPKTFALSQNYPNPFNPSTAISYQLTADSYVTLKVYDVLGREVAALVNERQKAGYHSVAFNAGSLPSGVYFYRITAGSYTNVKKMLLLK